MSDEAATKPASILASRAEYLIATAARVPSVQNTQPWRFKVTGSAVELYCDSAASCWPIPAAGSC
jgi:hypothetical protein